MDGPAKIHLALDVHHVAFADMDGGGDARGLAEGEITHRQHRQTVDLADLGAVGVDQEGAALDLLLQPLAHARGAVDLMVDGLLDVGGADHLVARLLRPVVRFAQHVGGRPRDQVAAQPRDDAKATAIVTTL